jgi:hypothetical protein
MKSTEAREGFGLLGLLLVEPGGSAFLKFVGPRELVRAERQAFLDLAASFRASSDGRPAESASPAQVQAENLAWTVPAGWRGAPDRPMSAARFFAGADELVECTLTILPGDAGGVAANANRWRAQLGAPPLEEHELALLERWPILGGEGVVVDAAGVLAGADGERIEDAAILGIICAQAGRSVFVKLSGPRGRVESERASLRAFSASLTGVP